MGHDVILPDINLDNYFVHAENGLWLNKHRAELTTTLWKIYSTEEARKHIDLCFFYIADGFVEDWLFEKIRLRGSFITNYSCNNIHQFHLVKNTSSNVDCCIYAELHAANHFQSLGVKAVQMQMGANPEFYKPFGYQYMYDASFVGQRYADRGELILTLLNNNIDVKVFGPRWKSDGEKVGNVSFGDRLDKIATLIIEKGLLYTGNYLLNKYKKQKNDKKKDIILVNHVGAILSDEEMVKVFNQTKINLGFSSVYSDGREGGKTLYHLRLRDFEIPISGGFYLTRYTEELEEYYKVGTEIETYTSSEELVSKTKYYLKHENLREKIRLAGFQRSIIEHTWEKRFMKLFSDPIFKTLSNKLRQIGYAP